MQHGIKLLIAAVLSLSVGIAFAAPLYIADMSIKPFPRNPEGPKADTSISVVYANFSISPGNTFSLPANSIMNSSVTSSVLSYEVVLNVTNLSDLGAKITRLGLTAAQDIAAVPTAVGFVDYISEANYVYGGINGGGGSSGFALSDDIVQGTNWGTWSQFKDGKTQAGGNGLVTGVWLDGNWINVTWVPGTSYPGWPAPSGGWFLPNATAGAQFNRQSMSDTWPITKTIPALPANASTEGTWVEGVPIMEMHDITTASDKTISMTTKTAIFINGTWIDVTGRVRTAHNQLFTRVTNTIVGERRYFGTEPQYVANVTLGSNSTLPWGDLTRNAQSFITTFTKAGEGEFNNYWAPHQSRLILLKGTRELLPNWGIDTLATGKVTLLAEEFNTVDDPSVNSTALYTSSGSYWLNQVTLQKTTNGYLYNTVLNANQVFEPDQWGVEVFITPRS